MRMLRVQKWFILYLFLISSLHFYWLELFCIRSVHYNYRIILKNLNKKVPIKWRYTCAFAAPDFLMNILLMKGANKTELVTVNLRNMEFLTFVS